MSFDNSSESYCVHAALAQTVCTVGQRAVMHVLQGPL